MAFFRSVLVCLAVASVMHAHCFELRRSSECEDESYRAHVLKLIKEIPFMGLFRDVKNQTKFEASGVAAVRGHFYVVFDSSMSVGYLDESFSFRGKANTLIGEQQRESQFEGIAYVPENDTFLLLNENRLVDGAGRAYPTFKPSITAARMKRDLSGYDIEASCDVEFTLEHENKGFESILYLLTPSGETYLLGLCEGNFCSGGSRGRESGNGRIVVSILQPNGGSDGGCAWTPVKVVNVPPSADFSDYSDMALNYETGKLAVMSQEQAAIWIGDFDLEAVDFASNAGSVYHLPRDNHCEMIYCNVEGLQWLDDYRLLVASDKAKSDQPFWCSAKDQSIHIFGMPPGWEPFSPARDPRSLAQDGTGPKESGDAAAVLEAGLQGSAAPHIVRDA